MASYSASASPEAIDGVASQSYFTGCSSTAAASSIAGGNGLMGNNIGVIIADKGEA